MENHVESEYLMSFPNIQQQVSIWLPGLPTPLFIVLLVVSGLVALGFVWLILRGLWAIISATFGLGDHSYRRDRPTSENINNFRKWAKTTMYYRNNSLNPNNPMNGTQRAHQQAQMNYPNNSWASNMNNPANINSPLNPNNPMNVAQRAHQQAQRMHQQAHQQAVRQAQQAHQQAQRMHRQAHQQAMRHHKH
jgi:FtsZ-interacting cell division protein ZipA